jgi:Domain of unknown function (DUF4349)
MRRFPRHGWSVPLTLILGAVLLGACTSSGGDGEAASGGAALERSVDDRSAAGGSESGRTRTSDTANRTAVQTRAVIRRGSIVVVTKNMTRARAEVDALVARHGGHLADEDTSNDHAGRPDRSTLVLRVPEQAFDEAMDQLGRLGRTVRADRSSEDVTTEVIDVDTRVATAEASLDRLQRFLGQAVDVEDMIRLESEIAKRQADLESLQAQQSYLRDQTALATITLELHTADAAPSVLDDDAGFLAGLSDGWVALKAVLVGLATVAGAVLPFAVTVALVGVPALVLVRTARRRRRPSAAPPTAEAG